ncbi:MAG TPA: shikimate kinase [Jatrophihabitantaceae bacterium]|jgi:shikimate kinase
MSPRAVLVGLPGTGKTTAGRLLAQRLGVPFADSDELVEARAGRSVREIFDRDGEGAFRTAEAEAIAVALREFDGVLALGGGAILAAATRTALVESDVAVVLLRADLSVLLQRMGPARERPLLAADPPGRLAALAAQREPLYRSVATTVVDAGHGSAAEVAAAIEDALAEPAWQT